MRASRACRARMDEPACRGEGDRVFRVVEHARIEPDAGDNLGRIDTELPQHLRPLGESANALLPFVHPGRAPLAAFRYLHGPGEAAP